MRHSIAIATAGTVLLGMAVGAHAADQGIQKQLRELQQTVKQQQQEIQQLRSKQSGSWLNEQRTEQVKTLVKDVLSDAETRASLAEGGMTAGHDGHFFIASSDRSFLLKVKGQSQIRYTYNNADREGGAALGDAVEHNEGFGIRRAKIGFYGHIYNKRLTYGVSLRTDEGDLGFSNTADADDTSDIKLENAYAAYEFADGWQVKGGQFKGPFLREEAVDSAHQLAAERSTVADLYTVDYTQGVQLSYTANMWRAKAMLHDGSYAANSNFAAPAAGSEGNDVAISGRAEFLLAGEWGQFKDFATWSGDSMGLMVGAGIDYEESEGGTGAGAGAFGGHTGNDLLKWTVDASFEAPSFYGFNAFAAVIGSHQDLDDTDNDAVGGAGTFDGADQLGFVVQGDVFVIPDKMDAFVRWEYVDLDGTAPAAFGSGALPAGTEDEISAITFGSNYYLHHHDAKATLDLIWVQDAVPFAAGGVGSSLTGAGLLGSGEDDQVAVRGQFQLLF